MPIPTDRGLVAITKDARGRTAVMVGTSITDGQVDGVYAMHVAPKQIVVDPAVRLSAGEHGQFTTEPVEVYDSGNAVQIRALDATADLRRM
ncbi:hypothetical protein ACGGAQ_31945 [Micromonospora sp. NPDC047557]|uniref:hypothetical protein n=1 Tax=Micromonospora sp. NPDC047557 TaxID=3364250 RepID=UPI0037246BF2